MSYLADEDKDYIRGRLAELRKGPWYNPGKWQVSHYNFIDAIKENINPPKKVLLNDITIRVMAQAAPGITSTQDEVARLAVALDEANLPYIEAFMWNLKSGKDVRFLTDLKLKSKIVMQCTSTDQLDVAADGGVDIATIMSPATYWLSPIYMTTARRDAWEGKSIESYWLRTEKEQFDRDVKLIDYAKSRGLEVRASTNMLSYSTIDYLVNKFRVETEAGADCISIYDGAEGMGPRAFYYVVSKLKEVFPQVPVNVHAHNNFGMAVANSIAAVEAGAEIVDVSVNGIGEHAGQADLAATAAALEMLYGIDTGLRFDKFTELRRLVEDLTQIKMPPFFPITGESAFSDCISEMTEELAIDPLIHYFADPTIFGNRRHNWVGVISDEWVLSAKLRDLGIVLTREQTTSLLQHLKKEIRVRKRGLSDEEILTAARTVVT